MYNTVIISLLFLTNTLIAAQTTSHNHKEDMCILCHDKFITHGHTSQEKNQEQEPTIAEKYKISRCNNKLCTDAICSKCFVDYIQTAKNNKSKKHTASFEYKELVSTQGIHTMQLECPACNNTISIIIEEMSLLETLAKEQEEQEQLFDQKLQMAHQCSDAKPTRPSEGPEQTDEHDEQKEEDHPIPAQIMRRAPSITTTPPHSPDTPPRPRRSYTRACCICLFI